jgi:membrane protein required for colicin V production
MSWVDWIIVIILAMSALGGVLHGFFRTSFSFVGLFGGLILAAWNYERLGATFRTFIPSETIADVAAFILIAAALMFFAALTGQILSRTAHRVGLGCFDRITGGLFGIFQGILLATAFILITVAFFPTTRWLTESKLPKAFFGLCHASIPMSPDDLASRIRGGLHTLEDESPQWMHPKTKVR